ncbi:PAAR-like domain-containing protein [Rahnella sp. PCH160]|uniref:PAAR-like domain-containing protein n=1 Tax=Rahnella sp. PCH160 TaxID=3447928 RepID=UPI0039FC70E3
MADKHIADGEAAFKAVSSAPDVCIVGIDPVPFDSFQTLINQKQYASTVWARGCSVLNVGSVIAGSQGNTGAGVASGTSLASGDCIILTGSPSVFIEGKAAARHGSQVGMNNMNCVGSLYTLVEPPLTRVKDNAIPCNNPPITSAALEQMKAKKEEMKKGLLASARNFVDVSDSLKSGDVYAKASIDKLRPGKIEGAGSAGDVLNAANEIGAGVVRGVLGLGWDLVSGVEHLANSAVQVGLSLASEELSLDAAILGENIRLGNICADGILQDAKKTLNAAKKAAAEEWDKASHASLGDQAEMATGIFGIIGTLFIGVGESEVVGAVSKASEVARVDEVNETVNTLDVIDASKVIQMEF